MIQIKEIERIICTNGQQSLQFKRRFQSEYEKFWTKIKCPDNHHPNYRQSRVSKYIVSMALRVNNKLIRKILDVQIYEQKDKNTRMMSTSE